LTKKMPEVHIYTDGACSGNPGPGGYGAILKYGSREKEISGGYRLTTNNRMELTGIIKSLEELRRPCIIKLYSDSKYIIDAFNCGWVDKWIKSGWQRGKKEPVKNKDLWQRLSELAALHKITWIWVKGHSSNEFNNRCDKMAVNAYKADNLNRDQVYEDHNC